MTLKYRRKEIDLAIVIILRLCDCSSIKLTFTQPFRKVHKVYYVNNNIIPILYQQGSERQGKRYSTR